MSETVIQRANLVRIEKFCDLTGYTKEAVQTKIKRHVWLAGHEYFKGPDGRILVSMEGYERWAAGKRRAA